MYGIHYIFSSSFKDTTVWNISESLPDKVFRTYNDGRVGILDTIEWIMGWFKDRGFHPVMTIEKQIVFEYEPNPEWVPTDFYYISTTQGYFIALQLRKIEGV